MTPNYGIKLWHQTMASNYGIKLWRQNMLPTHSALGRHVYQGPTRI